MDIKNKRFDIALRVCGGFLTICALSIYFTYNATAFPHDGSMQVIVPFSAMLGWIKSRWLSLHSVVGLCYLLSLIASGLLALIGIIIAAGGKKVFRQKRFMIAIMASLAFFAIFELFAIVTNFIAVAKLDAGFIGYILVEIATFIFIATILTMVFVQYKKINNQNTKNLEETNNEKN